MNESIFEKEREKLQKIFKDVEPSKAELVAGLIEETAFLKAQNEKLRATLADTGMVKIHPQHKGIQKPVEAARQYRQNVNSYAVLIKTLNGVLMKNTVEADDPFDKFMAEMSDGK